MADVDNEDENFMQLEPLYVKEDILKTTFRGNKSNNEETYMINNTVFKCKDKLSDEFVEFKLVARKMEDQNRKDSSDEEASNHYLDYTMALLKQGVIINNSIFLSHHQWNTILPVGNILYCILCNVCVFEEIYMEHVEGQGHLMKIQLYEPLAKFDLGIVRKIRNQYHCAVCNQIYDLNDKTHCESETHGENFLMALNKASDFMDKYNIKNETVHKTNNNDYKNRFNDREYGNSVNDDFNNDSDYDYEESSDLTETASNFSDYYYEDNELQAYQDSRMALTSYASMARKPKANDHPKFLEKDLGNRKLKITFESWNMIIKIKTNQFYCMACKHSDAIKLKTVHCNERTHMENIENCAVVEYEGFYIRMIDDKYYHCAHCNNLQCYFDIDDHIQAAHTTKKSKCVVDYKNSAKNDTDQKSISKTVTNNKALKKNNSNDEIKASNSDNKVENIIKNGANDNPFINNSINDNPPRNGAITNTLNDSTVDLKQKEKMIVFPKVNKSNLDLSINPLPTKKESPESSNSHSTNVKFTTKIFTNNSHTKINDIGKPKTENSNNDKTLAVVNDRNATNTNNDNAKRKNDLITPSGNNRNFIYDLSVAGLFENIVLNMFGYNLSVPVMSYNVISNKFKDFYCGICNMVFGESTIMSHTLSLGHIQYLQRIPFITYYNYNLIRPIREVLHCAICNMPTTPQFINMHISEPRHIELLRKALLVNVTRAHNIEPKPQTNNVPIPALPDTSKKNDSAQPEPLDIKEKSLNDKLMNDKTLNDKLANEKQINCTPDIKKQVNEKPVHCTPVNDKLVNNKPIIHEPVHDKSVTNLLAGIQLPKKQNTGNFEYVAKSTAAKPKNEINETKTMIGNTAEARVQLPKKQNTDSFEYVAKLTAAKPKNEINETKIMIGNTETRVTDDKIEIMTNNSMNTSDVEDETIDLDDFIYVKIKNNYFRITLSSYNTLTHIGDGSRFCFVCSTVVYYDELTKHVENRHHMENIEGLRFLEEANNLLRQLYLTYHCSVCNVLITRKDLKTHLDWPIHTTELKNSMVSKKQRRTDIKNGVVEKAVMTQNDIYIQGKDSECKVVLRIVIGENKLVKRKKLVICKSSVLKVPWENWHGIVMKQSAKCILCGDVENVGQHVSSDTHGKNLIRFLERYGSHLIREAKTNLANCVICNKELPNSEEVLEKHVEGKNHMKALNAITKCSTETDDYTDCDEEIFTVTG